MYFSVSLDRWTKILTYSTLVVFFVCIVFSILNLTFLNREMAFLLVLIFGLTILGSYVVSPTGYTLTSGELIIHRPLKNKAIKRINIMRISEIESGRIIRSIRTLGVGGLFGYFGSFWNKEFGHMKWYITNRNKVVLIETIRSKKILISPDERELFLKEYNL